MIVNGSIFPRLVPGSGKNRIVNFACVMTHRAFHVAFHGAAHPWTVHAGAAGIGFGRGGGGRGRLGEGGPARTNGHQGREGGDGQDGNGAHEKSPVVFDPPYIGSHQCPHTRPPATKCKEVQQALQPAANRL